MKYKWSIGSIFGNLNFSQVQVNIPDIDPMSESKLVNRWFGFLRWGTIQRCGWFSYRFIRSSLKFFFVGNCRFVWIRFACSSFVDLSIKYSCSTLWIKMVVLHLLSFSSQNFQCKSYRDVPNIFPTGGDTFSRFPWDFPTRLLAFRDGWKKLCLEERKRGRLSTWTICAVWVTFMSSD